MASVKSRDSQLFRACRDFAGWKKSVKAQIKSCERRARRILIQTLDLSDRECFAVVRPVKVKPLPIKAAHMVNGELRVIR